MGVAEVMRRRLRASDVLARLGGDEFAVLIPRGGLPEARTVAAALLEAIRGAQLVPGDAGVAVTASIGIATFEGRAGGAGILADADLAMYEAKRAGGDRSAHMGAASRTSASR
jgi:diguanylate cyclase (GGDEF)-like protein